MEETGVPVWIAVFAIGAIVGGFIIVGAVLTAILGAVI